MIIDKGNKMALTTKAGEEVVIRLEVNPKARRLILRLDERAREAVAVAPTKRALGEAAKFAEERLDWLAANLNALPQEERLVDGATFQLRGEPCRISLDGPGRSATLTDGNPKILSVPGAPETAGQRVLRYLRKAAKVDLSNAVSHYCATLNVDARRVSIKDTRSRWGSCTSTGNIAFSWRLIMAPPEVLEYVAAHECAHLLEMNHSPAFWAHVAKCRPDWQRERKWLHRHGRLLHAVTV